MQRKHSQASGKLSHFEITLELMKIKWHWHHCVSMTESLRNMSCLTLKVQGQNLTSGQGHMMTKIGHTAYHSMCLHKTNTMNPSPTFYLFSIKSYLEIKYCSKPHVTCDDLSAGCRQKTHLGHHGWSKILLFWKIWTVPMRTRGSRGILMFLHWLIMERSRHWPDLRCTTDIQIWDTQVGGAHAVR